MENWYYAPGAGKIKGQRITLLDRIRMRKRRRQRMKEWVYPWY